MRLFIAINFNEDVIDDMVRLQAELKRCRAAGNFTKPENLHLTLAFIGEYGNLDDILEVMETVPFHPVPLKFDGLQYFRNMYFAGIGHTPELESYVRRLRRALSGNGIPFDRKKFSPHVTLIRKVSFRDGVPEELPKNIHVRETVGISVSRVGGSAQIKSMKKVAGTLKIDQAQYRELESFSKFSSDMDAVTAMTLDRGRKNNQLLIQPQYSPMPVGEQIAIIYCGTHGLMHDVPVEKVRECQDAFLEKMRSAHAEIIATLASGKIDDEVTKVIESVMADTAGAYKS